jgi:hypothetical protein
VFEPVADLIWVNAHTPPVEIPIYLYINPVLQKLESISKFQVPDFVANGFTESVLASKWSVPTYAEMESYRKDSATFNVRSGNVMVDETVLSDWVVRHHMRGLSIDGKDVELERDENSVLTIEALTKLKSMHSGIYDLMYSTYKTEACLFI